MVRPFFVRCNRDRTWDLGSFGIDRDQIRDLIAYLGGHNESSGFECRAATIALTALHLRSLGIHQFLFDRLVQPPPGAMREYVLPNSVAE